MEAKKPVRRPMVWAASAGVAAAAFAFRWLSFTAFHNDHFDHVARAQQMLLGEWPVRGFVDPGFLGMYLVSAAGQWLTGDTIRTELVIAAAGVAIAAALTFRLAWLVSRSWVVAIATVAIQLLLYPRTYSYPKLLVFAIALSAAWHVRTQLTHWRLVGLAAVTAFGYYYRHDLGVHVGLACLALIIIRRRIASFGEPHRAALIYVWTCGLLIAPHLAYVQSTVGAVSYFRTALSYTDEEASRGLGLGVPPLRVNVRWAPEVDDVVRTRLERQYGLGEPEFREQRTWRYTPFDRSSDNIAAVLRDPHVEDTHNFDQLRVGPRLVAMATRAIRPREDLWSPNNAVQWLFWTWCCLPMASAVVLWRIRWELPSPDLRWTAMIVVLSAAAASGLLRSPLPARVPDVGVPMTLLAAWLATTLWVRPRQRTRQLVTRGAIVVCGLLLAGTVALAYNAPALIASTKVLNGPAAVVARWREVSSLLTVDRVPIAGSGSKTLRRVARYVGACTALNDRVLYAGYAPEIYDLARRGFAAGQITLTGRFHASRAEQAIALAKLRREHVPILLIPRQQSDSFSAVYDDIWTFLSTHYTHVTTVNGGHEPLEIWIASNRVFQKVWNDHKWPCEM